jgi:hypothetical protein
MQIDRQTGGQKNRQVEKQTGGQKTDKGRGRQADIQTKQADR